MPAHIRDERYDRVYSKIIFNWVVITLSSLRWHSWHLFSVLFLMMTFGFSRSAHCQTLAERDYVQRGRSVVLMGWKRCRTWGNRAPRRFQILLYIDRSTKQMLRRQSSASDDQNNGKTSHFQLNVALCRSHPFIFDEKLKIHIRIRLTLTKQKHHSLI